MKLNQTQIAKRIDQLDAEAARFREIAKGIALDLLQNPNRPDADDQKRIAKEHLVRAETLKTAAGMMAA